MKKMMVLLSALALMLALVAFAGCGDDAAEADASKAAATEAAPTEVATHDCDGGCGMTNMSPDITTEIDGKFYCTGCAKHLKEDNHEGHNH